MALFSKFRAQTIMPFMKRTFIVRFPNDGMPTDPRPLIKEFEEEPHGDAVAPVAYFMLWVVIPIGSVIVWYNEYQHYKSRHRMRFPKQDFLLQGVNHWPFHDGKHSCFHNEFYNFTPYGYETDKAGNRLPPGVYAEE